VLAPSGLFINADKYAQAGEAHHQALRYQVNSFFDVLLPREKYELLREWVLHYVEDEAPDRVMLEPTRSSACTTSAWPTWRSRTATTWTPC
jgi:hypothetical protein